MAITATRLKSDIAEVFDTPWSTRNGQVVPETKDISLTDGAVLLDATYVYADMMDSTGLAQKTTKAQAAKVIRAYLNVATRLLNDFGGEIRSFDGDRVMAIFIGDTKNSNAVKAALKINWAVREVVRPAIQAHWPSLGWNIENGIGIATGEAMLVRGGVRRLDNDIVSIGAAPNVAAKLSDLREGPDIYVTEDVYNRLNEDSKYSSGKDMWTLHGAKEFGGRKVKIYGSSHGWSL